MPQVSSWVGAPSGQSRLWRSIFQDEEQAQRVNSDSEEDEEDLRLEEMDLGDNEEEVESRVMQTQEGREERIGRVIHHREVANSEWKEHLEHAQEFRHRYSDERRRAKEEYDKVKEGLLAEEKYVPHWTFDLPHLHGCHKILRNLLPSTSTNSATFAALASWMMGSACKQTTYSGSIIRQGMGIRRFLFLTSE